MDRTTVRPVSRKGLLLELLQHFLRVARGIDFWIGLKNLPIFSNHIANALGVFIAGRFAGPIRQSNLAVGVTQEGERKLKLEGKSSVFFDWIKADAKDFYVFCIIFSDSIPESFAFVGSPGGVRLGVEPQDYFAPCKLT